VQDCWRYCMRNPRKGVQDSGATRLPINHTVAPSSWLLGTIWCTFLAEGRSQPTLEGRSNVSSVAANVTSGGGSISQLTTVLAATNRASGGIAARVAVVLQLANTSASPARPLLSTTTRYQLSQQKSVRWTDGRLLTRHLIMSE
jgi:hypothetical protein